MTVPAPETLKERSTHSRTGSSREGLRAARTTASSTSRSCPISGR